MVCTLKDLTITANPPTLIFAYTLTCSSQMHNYTVLLLAIIFLYIPTDFQQIIQYSTTIATTYNLQHEALHQD